MFGSQMLRIYPMIGDAILCWYTGLNKMEGEYLNQWRQQKDSCHETLRSGVCPFLCYTCLILWHIIINLTSKEKVSHS